MTKSAALIIGDRPEMLLERHRAAHGYALADMTDQLRQLAGEIAAHRVQPIAAIARNACP